MSESRSAAILTAPRREARFGGGMDVSRYVISRPSGSVTISFGTEETLERSRCWWHQPRGRRCQRRNQSAKTVQIFSGGVLLSSVEIPRFPPWLLHAEANLVTRVNAECPKPARDYLIRGTSINSGIGSKAHDWIGGYQIFLSGWLLGFGRLSVALVSSYLPGISGFSLYFE